MFEFGRDLRRLFEKARDSDDLGWLELIGAGLLETEARQQSVEAGRISCPQPFDAALRASILWREHARRTGSSSSIAKAEGEARDAARQAQGDDQSIRALIELAQASLLAFDLSGGPDRLNATETLLQTLPPIRRGGSVFALEALRARIAARRALQLDDSAALMTASTSLETLVLALKGQQGLAETELRLEQVSLSLELGLKARDLKRLDQAGRDLRNLVESSPADQRPLTRARALSLCAVGMIALSTLADAPSARQQGQTLFEAAASQFPLDHSPLDWSAIQLMRAQGETLSLVTLVQVEALTEHQGLILGAQAHERRLMTEITAADRVGDLTSLSAIESRLKHRLRHPGKNATPLDWVTLQIGLASVALAQSRWTGASTKEVGMMLIEAAGTAREMGAITLVNAANRLMPSAATV